MSFTLDDREHPLAEHPQPGHSQAENRQIVGDPRALRALAHPLRLALLDQLMAFGPQTASQCAAVVGSTASNCSYHLRSLERFGLVESMDAVDGRERPWRSAATGFQFGTDGSDPADSAATIAEEVLSHNRIDRGARLAHRALDQTGQLSPEWRNAMGAASYALRMTPQELEELGGKLDALIRPYIALTRDGAPADSAVVHLQLDAFRHPDAS